MSNHPPHLPPPPAGPPPPYPPPQQPPGGVPPRRTPWLLIVIAAVLAAVLVAGAATTVVLVTRDGDSDTPPVDRATDATTSQSATEVSSATVPTAVVTSAPPATTRDAVLGDWAGVYVCAQGDTRLRLTLDQGPGPADVTAVFAFGPTADNPEVPRGSYRMEGTLSEGLLDLHATTWIKKPAGYLTVDIKAPVVGDDPPQIMGDIVGAPECSTFAVTRQGR